MLGNSCSFAMESLTSGLSNVKSDSSSPDPPIFTASSLDPMIYVAISEPFVEKLSKVRPNLVFTPFRVPIPLTLRWLYGAEFRRVSMVNTYYHRP